MPKGVPAEPKGSSARLKKTVKSKRVGTDLRDDVRAFKRERIIGASIEVFYERGFQNATVDDVAASMSLTKAAVYYYFDSKEALLDAIIERCSDLTLEAIERGIAEGDSPATSLVSACYRFAHVVLDNQKLIALYFREERNFSSKLRQRVTATEKSVTLKLSNVLDAGIRAGEFRECDTQHLALNINGMISMSFYWYSEHARISKDALCRRFTLDALYLAGFKGPIELDKWLANI